MRAPPKFATDAWAWEYTRRKLEDKHGVPYEEWEGKLFAAAGAIYKRVLAKYGPGNEVPELLRIVVPVRGANLDFIAPGSAIVSGFMDDEESLIDFEGNTLGAPVLEEYEQRVQWAAQRHRALQPTSARALVYTDLLRVVGHIVGQGDNLVQITDDEALERYLGTGVTA